MARMNFESLETPILNEKFYWAKITNVNQNDTANIVILDGEFNETDVVLNNIPIYYHCSPNVEELPNGALKGSSSAFLNGDIVIVKSIDDEYKIISHYGEKRPCEMYFYLRYGQYGYIFKINPNDYTLQFEEYFDVGYLFDNAGYIYSFFKQTKNFSILVKKSKTKQGCSRYFFYNLNNGDYFISIGYDNTDGRIATTADFVITDNYIAYLNTYQDILWNNDRFTTKLYLYYIDEDNTFKTKIYDYGDIGRGLYVDKDLNVYCYNYQSKEFIIIDVNGNIKQTKEINFEDNHFFCCKNKNGDVFVVFYDQIENNNANNDKSCDIIDDGEHLKCIYDDFSEDEISVNNYNDFNDFIDYYNFDKDETYISSHYYFIIDECSVFYATITPKEHFYSLFNQYIIIDYYYYLKQEVSGFYVCSTDEDCEGENGSVIDCYRNEYREAKKYADFFNIQYMPFDYINYFDCGIFNNETYKGLYDDASNSCSDYVLVNSSYNCFCNSKIILNNKVIDEVDYYEVGYFLRHFIKSGVDFNGVILYCYNRYEGQFNNWYDIEGYPTISVGSDKSRITFVDENLNIIDKTNEIFDIINEKTPDNNKDDIYFYGFLSYSKDLIKQIESITY